MESEEPRLPAVRWIAWLGLGEFAHETLDVPEKFWCFGDKNASSPCRIYDTAKFFGRVVVLIGLGCQLSQLLETLQISSCISTRAHHSRFGGDDIYVDVRSSIP